MLHMNSFVPLSCNSAFTKFTLVLRQVVISYLLEDFCTV